MLKYIRRAKTLGSLSRTLASRTGWYRSFVQQKPLDKDGNPLPWYTYPAIEFLKTFDFSDARVFEYGCGLSSVFWASLAKSVDAVENDKDWAVTVNGFGVKNLKVHAEFDMEAYVSTPKRLGGVFDVVIIDGRSRRECAAAALEVVSPDGMIIFDNADWYRAACLDLREAGWFEIDFSGFGPINSYCWTTAAFVRAGVRFPHNQSIEPVGGLKQEA